MAERLIITKVKKYPKISEYVFEKDQEFIEKFMSFIIGLGFNEDEVEVRYLFFNKDAEYDDDKASKYVDINTINDERINISNDKYDIDIFVGLENIIVVIRTKTDMQEEISQKIFEIGDFIGGE